MSNAIEDPGKNGRSGVKPTGLRSRTFGRPRAPSDTIVVGGGGSEYESDSDLELYESTLKLQYNTVRGYVSAIQKLYDEQKSRESILRPGHRSGTEGAQTQHSCNDLEPEEEGIHGQGVGTLRDVYAPAQIPDHTNVAWSERRDRLRPEDAGYTTKALVVVMNCGKTNQHGRMEYGSALRHRDPRSCLIGALAFWLFWRWQVEKAERFPVFQRSEDWYETKVLRRSAKEPQAPLSGQTAREWTSRFYKKAGIKVSKVSHAPRVAATQNADMAGGDEGQIRRAGRWNNGDQMTGCYLTSCLSNS
ncbi:centromere DNA-binding protein complex CBF3 subunit [Hirsutella rhossiliensis]|uniref:Centromere DNA-binding protein complex CBF3 subunit n=1 Tax=Hirsutella rhossiliensis TaxID=111463 RepID=A0A9P8MSH9_9HYPO|nr:centromere DNA-binding protein complex CBF3 subunit [Hirsutella rhossiliensis]KAH0960475.1 centromere DNA-binding protein complex CBF3 subunit [Hirsutella rhossiliensis]